MLSALPYLQDTTNLFKQETDVWNFFVSISTKSEQVAEFKTNLLKNSYKFDSTADLALYEKVHVAKHKLGLDLPVTLYQLQDAHELNATIAYAGGEAHIVFSGKLIQALSDDELLALIAHELSHVLLYTQLNGNVETTDRIITAITNHAGSTPAHYETARLFKLYTEIFCDRGAFVVTGSYEPIISSLVKISTGLNSVNVQSYIKQAEEIFATNASTKTEGISHPENFIRARAIHLWHTNSSEAELLIQKMIEGQIGLDDLDISKQRYFSNLTQSLLKILLQPSWMRTPLTIALAKQYFANIEFSNIPPDLNTLQTQIDELHPNLKHYFSYVLFDFAIADKDLEDIPLGYCFFLANELNLETPFAATVKKERKLTDKKVTLLRQRALAEYHKQVQMRNS